MRDAFTDRRLAGLALARFGLGPRPGDLERVGSDPRGALMADLRRGMRLPAGDDLHDGPTDLTLLREQETRIRIARESAGPPAPTRAADGVTEIQGPPAPPKPEPPVANRVFQAEARARIALGTGEEVGFAERIVWFWSNHFAISASKGNNVRALAGAFEREAIRPHAFGRFADLLRAADTHPAMLLYLDNAGSVGPQSPAGRNRGRGLNENLGREILELHTLGVGRYGQDDVTALAAILTGWTVAGPEGRLGRPGAAAFNPNNHEPGEITLLARTYPDWGPDQLRGALDELARRPATATHIATKLARHFTADEPAPALVARLAETFRLTDGDLSAVYRVLIDAPEAWAPERRKVRSPMEFLVASARLLQPSDDASGVLLGDLGLLGQPLWTPPGPNGFGDGEADWASPEGLKMRLDIAARTAGKSKTLDPAGLLDAAFGEAVSRETREAVMRAETRQQAVALLLMSPEFQRR